VCMSGHNSGTPGAILTKLGTHIVICMCKNLIMFYIYSAGRMVWEAGNLDDSHCRGNKIIALLGNRLKHIRGNVRYLVTWNVKEFTVGYSTE
jgi:hypothetical protein